MPHRRNDRGTGNGGQGTPAERRSEGVTKQNRLAPRSVSLTQIITTHKHQREETFTTTSVAKTQHPSSMEHLKKNTVLQFAICLVPLQFRNQH